MNNRLLHDERLLVIFKWRVNTNIFISKITSRYLMMIYTFYVQRKSLSGYESRAAVDHCLVSINGTIIDAESF